MKGFLVGMGNLLPLDPKEQWRNQKEKVVQGDKTFSTSLDDENIDPHIIHASSVDHSGIVEHQIINLDHVNDG